MHWTVGKKRLQQETPVEAARTTAKATRVATAVGFIAAMLTIGGAVAVEVVDEEPFEVRLCTAVAIQDYDVLYEAGDITKEQYELLRADSIQDQIDDIAEC